LYISDILYAIFKLGTHISVKRGVYLLGYKSYLMDMGLRENISYGLPLPLKWLKQKHMEKLKENRIDIS
jgi:predicted proteasome-type protease